MPFNFLLNAALYSVLEEIYYHYPQNSLVHYMQEKLSGFYTKELQVIAQLFAR